MERNVVFGSQSVSYVLLPSDINMTSTLKKKCFLCNIKEIDGNLLEDSYEISLILCQIFSVHHMRSDPKKLENINYCHPCKNRILKIQKTMEILKKLEKDVLEEKYLIGLQLKNSYQVIRNELQYSSGCFGVELINEMKFKSIKSKLKEVVQNQIVRKVFLKSTRFRIMKNITIIKNLKYGSLEGHISELVIPKELTTPRTYNLISTDKRPSRNGNLSIPGNGHFMDSTTNSSYNTVGLPLSSHEYGSYDTKFETLSGETNIPADIRDPFEGIVSETDFVIENLTIQKPFICGTCETTFDNYNQLDEHCRTHVGSESFIFCPKEFASEVTLNTNSKIHVEKPFKCNYCMKAFPDRLKLELHERNHTRNKPFKCSYCERSFPVPYLLKRHEQTHAEEKPFKCGYCDKSFGVFHNMLRHERIHRGEKPFKCRYCDKTFRALHTMTVHERIHRGEKPFKCRYCDKTFRAVHTMTVHERTHTGVKPFICSYCKKTFSTHSLLKLHVHIHTGLKPYKCKNCDKTFRSYSTRKRHEYRHLEHDTFSVKEGHEYIHLELDTFSVKEET